MTRFSERIGLKSAKLAMKADEIDEPLKNGLWDVCLLTIFSDVDTEDSFLNRYNYSNIFDSITSELWHRFFKETMDSRPRSPFDCLIQIKSRFMKESFPYQFDFIDFVAQLNSNELRYRLNINWPDKFCEICNVVLEREMAAYRFVGRFLCPITEKYETEGLSVVVDARSTPEAARRHLKQALSLLSDRTNPDYKNSIKESVSAIECVCEFINGEKSKGIDAPLSRIAKKHKIHPAMVLAYKNLYGYTSDAGGIRHGSMDLSQATQADARYMLLSCSAFVGYLLSIFADGSDAGGTS